MFISSAASRALRPSWGDAAAWEVLPTKLKKTLMLARELTPMGAKQSPGCQLKAQSRPSKQPSLAMKALPQPNSSPGQP